MDDFSFGTLKGVGSMGEAAFEGGRPYVRFYAASEPMAFESQKQGRPVFRKVDMVQMQTPGQRDDCVREVQDWHKKAFATEWAAYEAGQEQVAIGTPLSVLFPANPEIVDGLRALKVHTVEQLSDLSDHAVQDMGLGASEFRIKAQRFLAQASKAAEVGRVEAAEQAVADMKAEMTRMRAELDAAKVAAPAEPATPAAPPVEPLRRKGGAAA